MKAIRFFIQLVACVATGLLGACLCILFGVGYWAAPICVFFVAALVSAAALGMFDDDETTKYDSIKHKTGLRYDDAA